MSEDRRWFTLCFTLLSWVTYQFARGGAVVCAMLAIIDAAVFKNPAKNLGLAAALAIIALLTRRELSHISAENPGSHRGPDSGSAQDSKGA